jgi:hypothetical protein
MSLKVHPYPRPRPVAGQCERAGAVEDGCGYGYQSWHGIIE